MARQQANNENAGAGRWLLTYADMITLLLVFFIVLYSISKTNISKYRAVALSLRQALGGAALPRGLPNAADNSLITRPVTPAATAKPVAQTGGSGTSGTANTDAAQQLLQMAKQLDQVLQGQVAVQTLVQVGDGALRISFQGGQGYFASASAQLKPGFEQILTAIAPVLKETGNEIEVIGYTNNLPLDSPVYPTAWELSAARADHVLRYLTEVCGLPPHQIQGEFMGQWHPQYPNNSPTNLARNRSVDIVVTENPPPGLNDGGPDPMPANSPPL